MKKIILILFVSVLFIGCSSNDEDIISLEELTLAKVENKNYISYDLQIGNGCLGVMAILFSRPEESKLVYSIGQIDCSLSIGILNYNPKDDTILVYKQNTTNELFATITDITENTFLMNTVSGGKYLFRTD